MHILKGMSKRILNRNRASVKAIAEALLDVEALDADELKVLLARTAAHA